MRTEHNKSLFSHYTKEAHAGSLTVTSFASNRTKQKRGKRTKQKTRNCTQKKAKKRTEHNNKSFLFHFTQETHARSLTVYFCLKLHTEKGEKSHRAKGRKLHRAKDQKLHTEKGEKAHRAE